MRISNLIIITIAVSILFVLPISSALNNIVSKQDAIGAVVSYFTNGSPSKEEVTPTLTIQKTTVVIPILSITTTSKDSTIFIENNEQFKPIYEFTDNYFRRINEI